MTLHDVEAFHGGEAHEPWTRALRADVDSLVLREVVDAGETAFDVRRFLGEADALEHKLVGSVPGPVLDLGCGPGRMIAAAIRVGHDALGVDVSPSAVQLAVDRGLPVLRRSVFDPLPDEGMWGSAILLDGNIGIGGDPAALLARCAQLVRAGGHVVVETHPDHRRDRLFDGVLVDDEGRVSTPFPWAQTGHRALRRYARAAKLELVREWAEDGRHFAEYTSVGGQLRARRRIRRDATSTTRAMTTHTTKSLTA